MRMVFFVVLALAGLAGAGCGVGKDVALHTKIDKVLGNQVSIDTSIGNVQKDVKAVDGKVVALDDRVTKLEKDAAGLEKEANALQRHQAVSDGLLELAKSLRERPVLEPPAQGKQEEKQAPACTWVGPCLDKSKARETVDAIIEWRDQFARLGASEPPAPPPPAPPPPTVSLDDIRGAVREEVRRALQPHRQTGVRIDAETLQRLIDEIKAAIREGAAEISKKVSDAGTRHDVKVVKLQIESAVETKCRPAAAVFGYQCYGRVPTGAAVNRFVHFPYPLPQYQCRFDVWVDPYAHRVYVNSYYPYR